MRYAKARLTVLYLVKNKFRKLITHIDTRLDALGVVCTAQRGTNISPCTLLCTALQAPAGRRAVGIVDLLADGRLPRGNHLTDKGASFSTDTYPMRHISSRNTPDVYLYDD